MFLTSHLGVISPAAKRVFHQNKRLILPLLILVCLALPDSRAITITALSDAFFPVSYTHLTLPTIYSV